MVQNRKGYFVQIWRPASPFQTEYVDMSMVKNGRGQWWNKSVATTQQHAGWSQMSRELNHRKAKKFAKNYQQAGFETRIVYRGASNQHNPVVTDTYKKKN